MKISLDKIDPLAKVVTIRDAVHAEAKLIEENYRPDHE